MSVASSTKSVTTTAAVIGTPSAKRSTLVIYVPESAANPVVIGGSNVTTANGVPLSAGERLFLTNDGANGMPASQDWYAIVGTTSVTVQITEAL